MNDSTFQRHPPSTQNPLPMDDLPGRDVSPFPFMSAAGLLTRVMRLNRFDRSSIYAATGLLLREGDDITAAVLKPGKHLIKMAMVSRLSAQVTSHWGLDSWLPFALSDGWNELRCVFRWCEECLRFGYHTQLFQLPFIKRCPWHHVDLVNHCPACGHSARVLEFSAFGFALCKCGYDFFDERVAICRMSDFPTEDVEATLSPYVRWCEKERRHRILIVPPRHESWLNQVASLVSIPKSMSLSIVEGRNLTRSWKLCKPPLLTVTADEMTRWIRLANRSRFSLAQVPRRIHESLFRVTRVVTRRFYEDNNPAPGTTAQALSVLASVRPWHFLYPYDAKISTDTWMRLTTIEATTLDVMALVVRFVLRELTDAGPGSFTASTDVQQGRQLATSISGEMLHRALSHLMLRGYACGLWLTIKGWGIHEREKVPAWLAIPMVELDYRVERYLNRIHIVWLPSSPQRSCPKERRANPTKSRHKLGRRKPHA